MYKKTVYELSENDVIKFNIWMSSDRQYADESDEMILKQRSFHGRMDMFVVDVLVDDESIGRFFITPYFEKDGFSFSFNTDDIRPESMVAKIAKDAEAYFVASPEYAKMLVLRDGVNTRVNSLGGWKVYRENSRAAYNKCEDDKKAIVVKYIDWFKESSEKIGSHAFSHNGMPDEITDFIKVNGRTGGSWGIGHLNYIYKNL